ncbi:hypothetical protein H671_2g4379 [Cricetulus griseus]|nr:hypothetical protein H671_2g4379 [Cricetulus griseus]
MKRGQKPQRTELKAGSSGGLSGQAVHGEPGVLSLYVSLLLPLPGAAVARALEPPPPLPAEPAAAPSGRYLSQQMIQGPGSRAVLISEWKRRSAFSLRRLEEIWEPGGKNTALSIPIL